MSKISTPTFAANQATSNLFYYRNATSQIHIVRIDQMISQRLEKVVFPGERMLFCASAEASLDIYVSTATGLTLLDQIPCARLQVVVSD